ncbi:MAG TPA: glycosyltransferase family 2 protein [Acidobacteriota bacterium]|nr:glycosyltransferase family 2 protein [Acidobacteriota bacterium]
MEAVPKLTAVCVNYNGAEVLPVLLDCLRACSPPPRLIVVDSASKDASAEDLGQDVEVVRLEENQGYAAALNAGIRQALSRPPRADYFLLLNNDLEFEPSAVAALVECACSREAWVAGPKVVDRQRPWLMDAAWGRLTYSHVLTRFEGKGREADDYRQTKSVDLLLGCALLVRRETFDRVGLFDPRYFMYHEEVDFLFRCKQAGLERLFCPRARFLHRGAYSTRRSPLRKVYWVRRNALYFMFKHQPGPAAWVRWAVTLAASLLFNLVTLRGRRLSAILRGVRDGFKGGDRPGGQQRS